MTNQPELVSDRWLRPVAGLREGMDLATRRCVGEGLRRTGRSYGIGEGDAA